MPTGEATKISNVANASLQEAIIRLITEHKYNEKDAISAAKVAFQIINRSSDIILNADNICRLVLDDQPKN